MLVNVKDLPASKKQEYMELVKKYKTDGVLRQTLHYQCHQDHLWSSKIHDDYDTVVEQRAKTLSQFKFNDYVSMLGDKIIGLMSFTTTEVNDKIIGTDMLIWRVAEKQSYTYGKDLNAIKELYEQSCHICNELIVYGDGNKEYEDKFGAVLVERYPNASLSVTKIRCRDGRYRYQLTVSREGKL